MNEVVVFDFDKTITSTDTFLSCIVHLFKVNYFRSVIGIVLLPIFFFLKCFPRTRAHAASFSLWMATCGRPARLVTKDIKSFAEQYKRKRKPGLVRQDAIINIWRHINLGHAVIIVSTSSAFWIRRILGKELVNNVRIVGSVFEFRYGGLLVKNWCYGKTKLDFIFGKELPRQQFLSVYTDCLSDSPMLEKAKNKFLITKDNRGSFFLKQRKNVEYLIWR